MLGDEVPKEPVLLGHHLPLLVGLLVEVFQMLELAESPSQILRYIRIAFLQHDFVRYVLHYVVHPDLLRVLRQH